MLSEITLFLTSGNSTGVVMFSPSDVSPSPLTCFDP